MPRRRLNAPWMLAVRSARGPGRARHAVRHGTLGRALLALAAAALMAGCATSVPPTNATLMPAADGEMTTQSLSPVESPAATPAPVFPAVHDIPPPTGQPTLTDYEQRKLQDDLIAIRKRLERPTADTEKSRP